MITFQTDSVLYITGGTNHGNMVIAKPAGTVEGDLLIWSASEDRPASRTYTVPAGWTIIDQFFAPTRSEAGALAFKIAGPSEPANYTFQVLPSQSSASASTIMRFSTDVGFLAGSVIHAFARTGLFQIPGAAPVDWICPSVSPIVTGTRVLRYLTQRFSGNFYNDGNFNYQSGPAATEIQDRGSGDVTNRSGFAGYLQDAVVGIGPTGTAVIRQGFQGVTGYEGWTWTVALAETVPDFQSQEEAEARAREKVADGTWVNAHSEREFEGASAVRFQRFMSPASPGAGAWVETTDTIVT